MDLPVQGFQLTRCSTRSSTRTVLKYSLDSVNHWCANEQATCWFLCFVVPMVCIYDKPVDFLHLLRISKDSQIKAHKCYGMLRYCCQNKVRSLPPLAIPLHWVTRIQCSPFPSLIANFFSSFLAPSQPHSGCVLTNRTHTCTCRLPILFQEQKHCSVVQHLLMYTLACWQMY